MHKSVEIRDLLIRISVTDLLSLLSAIVFSAGMFLLISAFTDIIVYNLFDIPMTEGFAFLLSSNREVINISVYYVVLVMFLPSYRYRNVIVTGSSSLFRLIGFLELLLVLTVMSFFLLKSELETYWLIGFLSISIFLMHLATKRDLQVDQRKASVRIKNSSTSRSIAEKMASGAFEILSLTPEIVLFLLISTIVVSWEFLVVPFLIIVLSRLFYQRRTVVHLGSRFNQQIRSLSYLIITFLWVRHILIEYSFYLELPFNTSPFMNHLFIFTIVVGISIFAFKIINGVKDIKPLRIRFQ